MARARSAEGLSKRQPHRRRAPGDPENSRRAGAEGRAAVDAGAPRRHDHARPNGAAQQAQRRMSSGHTMLTALPVFRA